LPRKGTSISTDLVVSIKDSFISRRNGVLISADYSQIEIRMMAHLSKDPKLIEIFAKDKEHDIYKVLASKIFKVTLDSISDEQRSHAKTLCLAIIYGLVIRV
jgi:DNA polymerase-1